MKQTQMNHDLLSLPPLELAPALLGATIVTVCLPQRTKHISQQDLSRSSGYELVAVRISETEAYCGSNDPGSHASSGWTKRNSAMFGPGYRLYIYFTYGMHWLANIVTEPDGEPGAVLLRGGDVVYGQQQALLRRNARRKHRLSAQQLDKDPALLARGPANMAVCLGLDGRHNGSEITSVPPGHSLESFIRDNLIGEYLSPAVLDSQPSQADPGLIATFLLPCDDPPTQIKTSGRIGIRGEGGDATRFPWRFYDPSATSVSPYRS